MSEISQGDPEIYLTLFLGVLDMRKFSFEYSSAGIHVPPIVLSGWKAVKLFEQSDFAIGHVAGHEYGTSKCSFASGDVFLFVSDGVIEVQRGEDSFGMERLLADAERIHRETGVVDIDVIVGSVRSFLGEEPPQDDICLLTIAFGRLEEQAQ
jgi:serine phosphatase RsbU (regulator of sigma subunit)